MIRVLKILCWIYFMISAILSIPMCLVIDFGFSMSGYLIIGMMSFFCSVPMAFYFWPWRKTK